ncbi:MAG TPA: caspase family protein [Gallionellaceae bacterium]
MHWLLDGVQPGDERVLFYSGHGAQMPVYGPTREADHMDECLVPWDFDWTPEHAVTDKQFLNLYSQLPYDCHFVAIFDCCHSGGMTREGSRKARGLIPPDDIRHRAMRWNAELQMWEDRPLVSPNPSLAVKGTDYLGSSGSCNRMCRAVSLRGLERTRYDATRRTLKHHGPYLPVIMEACQENQLSYEYRHGTQSYGAFTYSLAASLRASRKDKLNPSFQQLVSEVQARLKQLKYAQTPNLVGPKSVLKQEVPWVRQGVVKRRRGKK